MIKHEWTFICKEFAVTETGVFSIIEVSRDFLFEGFPGKIEPFTIVSSFLGGPGETFEYSVGFTDPLNSNRKTKTDPIHMVCSAPRRAGYKATATRHTNGLVVYKPGVLVFDILVNNKVVHQEDLLIQAI